MHWPEDVGDPVSCPEKTINAIDSTKPDDAIMPD
jgi:hypothetical protein